LSRSTGHELAFVEELDDGEIVATSDAGDHERRAHSDLPSPNRRGASRRRLDIEVVGAGGPLAEFVVEADVARFTKFI